MSIYQETIYSTLYESWMGEGHEHDPIGRHLRWKDISDQLLIEYLIRKLKRSFVIYENSSDVLYLGRVEKLDRRDYAACARRDEDGIWIPVDFFNLYFQEASTEPRINLTKWIAGHPDYVIHSYGKMSIVSPQKTVVFLHPEECEEELSRLRAFFEAPALPYPDGDSERTAKVVTYVPFEKNPDYRTHHYKTCYSPGLLSRGDALYVSHEYSEVCNWKELSTETVLKKSVDGGETWETLGAVPDMRWAALTEIGDALCLLGSHLKTREAMIARWNPSRGCFETAVIAGAEVGGGAPSATVTHNGRFFRSYDKCVLSVRVGDDILDPSSWTQSTPYTDLLTKEWYLRESGETVCSNYKLLEGNMVLGRDGEVYNMLRIDCFPRHGYAALLRISADGKECHVVKECNSLIRFPELAVSKFTARYDPATDRYLSLVSVQTLQDNLHEQRNVLGLAVSDDLMHWRVIDVLLTDRAMMNATCSAFAHAFQYVDWVISKGELLYLVREANGYTSSFHDGNYCTFYRLKDYAQWIEKKDPSANQKK